MSTLKKIVAVTVLTTACAAIAGAQGCLTTGNDGKTASPRWREFLDEQSCRSAAISPPPAVFVAPATYQVNPDDGIAASPRYREFLTEENAQIDAQQDIPEVAAENSVGYQATGDDGITASPRYREFLNEREATQPAD